MVVKLPDGRRQIVHVDRMCNECGNCLVFCPYDSRPYKDKFTVFLNEEEFADSTNQGFLNLGDHVVKIRLNGEVKEVDLKADTDLPKDVELLILTILKDYSYLL